MQAKVLQQEDKCMFVKQLYDYASRGVNQRVRALYAQKTGMSESSFRDKMCGSRNFKGYELDVIESIYLVELGKDVYDNQFQLFLTKMSNGDLRAIEQGQAAAINELTEQNEQLVVSHTFNL